MYYILYNLYSNLGITLLNNKGCVTLRTVKLDTWCIYIYFKTNS